MKRQGSGVSGVSVEAASAGGGLAAWLAGRKSPLDRRACEMVEMACLKINCSCAFDSSRIENLSKLRMRPVSFVPLMR